jgi:hypothetical protein
MSEQNQNQNQTPKKTETKKEFKTGYNGTIVSTETTTYNLDSANPNISYEKSFELKGESST